MAEQKELEEKIRQILLAEFSGSPEKVERTTRRIVELVDSFEKAAREEMDRYRATFAELAK